MQNLKDIQKAVREGLLDQIVELVSNALKQEVTARQILDDGLIAGMQAVGECFKKNEMFIPEVMISAKTMQMGMNVIEPLLLTAGCKPKGHIIIGTVKGDLHDIGKNLVAMMLKSAGFEVIDLGIDVSPEKFLEAAKQTQAKIVAMSALITTSMPSMQTTVSIFKENRLGIKTMVGGAPVTNEFAIKIGAGGYAPDAVSAVDLAIKLYND